MLCVLFMGIFCEMGFARGWKRTACIWIISLALVGWAGVAIFLMLS